MPDGRKSGPSWGPWSSAAYGGNAVYVPRWGEPGALEFIVVMYQNYPTFKTHTALDVFHGYVSGAERFRKNHEFRVLGWQIERDLTQWSFLYLPTEQNSVRAMATFRADSGSLRMTLELENPSAEDREWEFHLYCAPCETENLPNYRLHSQSPQSISFDLGVVHAMTLRFEQIRLLNTVERDSSFWINFPANAETCSDPCNPLSPAKKRLLMQTSPIRLCAGKTTVAAVDFLPETVTGHVSAPVPRAWRPTPPTELPYRHEWWETLHNQQYTRSFVNGKMTNRCLPARQWKRFFLWDVGMTAVGALEEDDEFAEELIAEMPDPARCGAEVFAYGSYIPTAIYAWWELFQKQGDRRLLERHYPLMRRLAMAMLGNPALEPDIHHDGMVRSLGGLCGADDYPATVYADGWPFAWDYERTLPVNPDHQSRVLIMVGLTALALRCLKILRLAAFVLDRKEELEFLTPQITRMDKELNLRYWCDVSQSYLNRLDGEPELLRIPGLYDHLPLFAGAADTRRRGALLHALASPAKYWSQYGLTVVAQDDPNYREDGYWNGAVWMPPQWFFWKAFYNLGEMKLARDLADRVLRLWEANHQDTLCCWEEFRVKTGQGAGNSRFSGLSTPVLSLHAARRRAGRVQMGQDVIGTVYANAARNEMRAELRSPFWSGTMGMSAVLTPDMTYEIRSDGIAAAVVKSDCWGYLDFTVSIEQDKPTLVETIPTDK